jgi:esterase/lipase
MVSWESWVTQAKTALETVAAYSDEAYVVGLSLGGTISMILNNLTEVKGLVLLSPALFPRRGLKSRLYELGRIATPTLFYRMAGWNGEVLKAMDFAKQNSKKLEVPILALQARDDKHLSNRGLKFLRRRASHSRTEITILPFGSHVLTRGQAKTEVFDRIYKFLKKS